jgi:hypothetical protein
VEVAEGLVAGHDEAAHDVLVELLVVGLGELLGGAHPESGGLVDLLLLVLLALLVRDLHADRVHHVVGVAADDGLEAVALEELAGLGLEVELDAGAAELALARADRKGAVAGGAPVHGLVIGEGAEAVDVDAVGDHEGAVEADAELADEVEVGLLPALLLGLGALEEIEGAGVGDGAEVQGHLIAGHADAVVLDDQDAGLLIGVDLDHGLGVAVAQAAVDQALEAGLVERVGGVREQLAEEDLPVGVEGVGHQPEERADLGLELVLLCLLVHVGTFWASRDNTSGTARPQWAAGREDKALERRVKGRAPSSVPRAGPLHEDAGQLGRGQMDQAAVPQLGTDKLVFAGDMVGEAGRDLEAELGVDLVAEGPVGGAEGKHAGGVDLDELVEQGLHAELEDGDIDVLERGGQHVDLCVAEGAVGLGADPEIALVQVGVDGDVRVEDTATERGVEAATADIAGHLLQLHDVVDDLEGEAPGLAGVLEVLLLRLLAGREWGHGELGGAALDGLAFVGVDPAHDVGVRSAEIPRDGAFAGEADAAPGLAVLLLDHRKDLAQALGARDSVEEVALLLIVPDPIVEDPQVVVPPIEEEAEVDVTLAVVDLFDWIIAAEESRGWLTGHVHS